MTAAARVGAHGVAPRNDQGTPPATFPPADQGIHRSGPHWRRFFLDGRKTQPSLKPRQAGKSPTFIGIAVTFEFLGFQRFWREA